MTTVIVLSVGYDAMILETRGGILRSAGYFVESASSLSGAIELFGDSDFDAVLLCHSLPEKDRERLSCAIRTSGSHVPIIVVAPNPEDLSCRFADAVVGSDPLVLVAGIEKALYAVAHGHLR